MCSSSAVLFHGPSLGIAFAFRAVYISATVGIFLFHRRRGNNGDLGMDPHSSFLLPNVLVLFLASVIEGCFLLGGYFDMVVSVDCWVSCLGCCSVALFRVFWLLSDGVVLFFVSSYWLEIGRISFL